MARGRTWKQRQRDKKVKRHRRMVQPRGELLRCGGRSSGGGRGGGSERRSRRAPREIKSLLTQQRLRRRVLFVLLLLTSPKNTIGSAREVRRRQVAKELCELHTCAMQ
jgi:hypothetical protein